MAVHIIKGCPADKWEEVQAIQDEPFVYIMSNGSRWFGEEEGDIAELLEVLSKHRIDYERFTPGYIHTLNPCEGIYNPAWNFENEEPRWINGPRMYRGEVHRFGGNFEHISHVFSIDTNDPATIVALTAAIEANQFVQEEIAA